LDLPYLWRFLPQGYILNHRLNQNLVDGNFEEMNRSIWKEVKKASEWFFLVLD
jgi:hypothetical protein